LKQRFENVEVAAVNQCSGNSRGFFQPRVPGGQMGHGAMGCARWRGVRLKDVLQAAGLAASAKQVLFNGLDTPLLPQTPDFIKAVDLELALEPELLLAWDMNGEPLPWLNGFPLRLVVPGYYGTYWIKHVHEITVVDETFKGFWMDPAYRIPDDACAHIEPGTPTKVEDRTGDTGSAQRGRQRVDPPHILLTTPESLALMLSYEEAPAIFGAVSRVIVDEIHALAESKRGDQLMLGLARLQALAPGLRRVGLSATVEDPPALAAYLGGARVLLADPGPEPDLWVLATEEPPPWAGQTATYAARAVMDLIRGARTTLVFINTRAQAEVFFLCSSPWP
jgi:hypothetical protein